MNVRRVAREDCVPFFLDRHYAKRVPQVHYACGLFVNDRLEGVVSFGKPASPAPCVGVCGPVYAWAVWELNRLALNSTVERNAASFLVAHACRMFGMDEGLAVVISWADTGAGHIGYVYQACNWLYTGCSKPRTDPKMDGGSHPRHYDKTKMQDRQERHPKHRYVHFCGDTRKVKECRKQLRWDVLPYPKGDTLRHSGHDVVRRDLFSALPGV